MKFENLFHIILISFLAITACNPNSISETSQPIITISLSADSTAVELHQVPQHILEYFQADSLSLKEWQSFFSVYPDASDPELRGLQSSLTGRYFLQDSTIVFVPQQKFQKDSTYYARFYIPKALSKPSDIFIGKNISDDSELIEFDFKR